MVFRITRNPGPYSLSSYINTMLNVCHWARKAGHQVYIDWRDAPCQNYRDQDFNGNPNLFEWFFEQPFELTAGDVKDAPLYVYEEDEWRRACGDTEAIRAFEQIMNTPPRTEEAMGHLGSMARTFLKFKKPVVDWANVLFYEYKLNPNTLICLSYRGMDRGMEVPLMPVERAYPTVHKIKASHPKAHLWMTADEGHAQEAVRNTLSDAVIIDELWASPECSRHLNADNLSRAKGYDKALGVATLILMRSKCRWLVGNWSNSLDLSMALCDGEVFRL